MSPNLDLGLATGDLAELQRRVRSLAAELLASRRAAVVIGHRAPWSGWQAVPHLARTAAEAAELVVGPVCGAGLAKYLLDELPSLTEGQPAVVVARGCDLLGVRRLVADHRVAADLVRVLAIPCVGRLDRNRVVRAETAGERSGPGTATDCLADVCTTCTVRWPDDVSASDGEAIGLDLGHLRAAPGTGGAGATGMTSTMPAGGAVAAVSALSPDERLAHWSKWFSRCIRCYACRSVCPACHCEVCVLDSAEPSWLPRSTGMSAQFMFQFIRGMDVAGRCVGCGQCESACPVGIPLAQLWSKTASDVGELFGIANPFLPGPTEPLGEFAPHDPDPTRPGQR